MMQDLHGPDPLLHPQRKLFGGNDDGLFERPVVALGHVLLQRVLEPLEAGQIFEDLEVGGLEVAHKLLESFARVAEGGVRVEVEVLQQAQLQSHHSKNETSKLDINK